MDNVEMIKIYMYEQSYRIDSLKKYLPLGKEQRIFSGEILKNEKDEDFLFYIKSGRFKLSVPHFSGEWMDFCECCEGSTVQLNDFLMNATSWDPARAVAAKNSVVVSFSRQQLFEIIRNDQKVFDEYLNLSSTYSTMLKQRLLITSEPNASQRLLVWLEKLCSVLSPDEEGVYHIPCQLTQQQIANYLFIHVTTCNKLLMALARVQILRREKGFLHIYDRDLLKKYLENNWILS